MTNEDGLPNGLVLFARVDNAHDPALPIADMSAQTQCLERWYLFLDSATWAGRAGAIVTLCAIQRITGWPDALLLRNWFAFFNVMPAQIWGNLGFCEMDVADMFYAITVLQIVVNIGAIAWEQL